MNKANQNQVVQTANVNLVAIRSSEINYFNIFFGNFATQAALLVTCIIQSVSQLPGMSNLYNDDDYYVYYSADGARVTNITLAIRNETGTLTCNVNNFIPFKSTIIIFLMLVTSYRLTSERNNIIFSLYWVSAAITFVASMFILLNAIYISIFGEGMAIRGPIGSMVKAINGMAHAQDTTLSVFVFTAFIFGLNVAGMSWGKEIHAFL